MFIRIYNFIKIQRLLCEEPPLREMKGRLEMSVILDGNSLTLEEVIKVAREGEKVELCPDSAKAVEKTRAYVDKKLADGSVIYGLTTGFGKFSDTLISRDQAADLQRNLITSHTCAMGEPLKIEYVRAAMLMRCNALAKGFSGIRLETLNTMISMLNAGVTPVVPEKGSLGSSGDLAPLSMIVLTMIGHGEAFYQGERMASKEAMDKAGIPTIELVAKEGLALINGTQIMTGVGACVLHDAKELAKLADIVAAMTGEALHSITKAYDPKVHAVRGQQGQIDSAANLLRLLEGSQNSQPLNPNKVQDPYSLRCVPQVHGGSRDAIDYVESMVAKEINAVTDNPLIFPDEDEVISGGNFHGQPMAIAFDTLKIAISEFANISERRAERLINPQLSEGLPPFLTEHGGVCSGFMIAQYAAASMVSENKIYAHPASVDSIPSSGNQEDHVSMGTTAARTAALILDNAQKVLAIEIFSAYQALSLRGAKGMSPSVKAIYDHIAKTVDPVDEDIIMHDALKKFDAMVKSNELVEIAERIVGQLK